MPVHIEEMTTNVSVVEGELPLTSAQIEKLVALVIKRLSEQQLDAKRRRDATQLRRQSSPSFEPAP
jgi:hypothetical protein